MNQKQKNGKNNCGKFKKRVDKENMMWYNITVAKAIAFVMQYGGVAQLARATGSYPVGHGFKSNLRYTARWSSG